MANLDSPPSWELDTEYTSFDCLEWRSDVELVESSILKLQELSKRASDFIYTPVALTASEQQMLIQILRESHVVYEAASDRNSNCLTYANCLAATDVTNDEANRISNQRQKCGSDLWLAYQAQALYLMRATPELFAEYIDDPRLSGSRFYWEQRRLHEGPFLLSEAEESLLTGLSLPGFSDWSSLYDKISGTMRVEIVQADGATQTVGLAEAQALIKQADANTRRLAWEGIQKAWTLHREPAAAVLNALSGWRLELVKRRSVVAPAGAGSVRQWDFLSEPLARARVERETLEAMVEAVRLNLAPLRRILGLMSRLHGRTKMDPWDLLAPCPTAAPVTENFAQGFQKVVGAFSSVAPEFGQFATMMLDRGWIESRVLPNKRGGAYCTRFAKSGHPRVFQTFMGSYADVSTLAHELGHAYHGWIMRDLPRLERNYPMPLAETASIFAEAALADHVLAKAELSTERLAILYAEMESAVGLLLNIMARFEFERSLYQRRQTGILSAQDLSQLMDSAWTHWYGEALSQNDKMFWASKLHFHLSRVSFYNFPYTFGYLFSLSLYSRRFEAGEGFFNHYKGLLRDTGRMTAEQLVDKHLGEDIRTTEFWQKSLTTVHHKAQLFEELVNKICP